MTSPTLSVLPAAPAAPQAPVSTTTGPAAAHAPKDDGFAQQLHNQQQHVQNKASQKAPPAKSNTSETAAPADRSKPADSVAELAEQVDLEALNQDPAALLIAADLDTEDALEAQADSGLPAMALSILSQVQAIKNGKADAKATPNEAKLNLAHLSTRQNLASELNASGRQLQTGPVQEVQADSKLDLSAELALPKAVDSSNPLAATPVRKAVTSATLSLNGSAAQAVAAANAASSQTRFADEAAASLAAFGRQMAEDARAGTNLNLPPLDAALLAQLGAAPGASTPPAPAPAMLPVSLNLAVATPVQSPEWGAALGRQLITLAQQAQGGIQSADIRLDPPELGPLRITLQMQDGITHAMITSPHAQVRQALEQSLQQLQQQLADNGLTLGQADVGDQHASHQAFQEQLAARSNKGDQTAFSLNGHEGLDEGSPLAGSTVTRVLDPNALVDTFA